MQAHMRDSGLASATVNLTLHGALMAMLRDAETAGELPAGFRRALYAQVPRLPVSSHEDTAAAYARAEVREILDGFRRWARYGLEFVSWLAFTGMRPGEALALRWLDVDLRRRWCRVHRSRLGAQFSDAKPRHSRREIRLACAAVAVLAALKAGSDAELVFLTPRGRPLDLHNLEHRCWWPVLRHLTVPKRPLYSLRHSWISWQIESGKDLAAVARAAGNTPDVIRTRYYRYTRDWMDEDWDEALEAEHARSDESNHRGVVADLSVARLSHPLGLRKGEHTRRRRARDRGE